MWSLCPPPRCVSGVAPVQGEAAWLRRLQREDPGPLHAAGAGPLLARGLPEVRLLRLPPGPGGLHPLHPGQPHPVPQGLPEVTPGGRWRLRRIHGVKLEVEKASGSSGGGRVGGNALMMQATDVSNWISEPLDELQGPSEETLNDGLGSFPSVKKLHGKVGQSLTRSRFWVRSERALPPRKRQNLKRPSNVRAPPGATAFGFFLDCFSFPAINGEKRPETGGFNQFILA